MCDRLLSLSYVIDIALNYNRVLHIDWRDRVWSDGEIGFFDFFTLVDIPYVSSLSQIPDGVEVFPEIWNAGLNLHMDTWGNHHNHQESVLFDPCNGFRRETIWVHHGLGSRAPDLSNLSNHIRLLPEVSARIIPDIEQVPKELPIVHLRGTDRGFDEENWARLRKAAPEAGVVSDDQRLASRWMEESPGSVLLSDEFTKGTAASHMYTEDELREMGLKKFDFNLRSLKDFLLIMNADQAFGLNERSVFFDTARKMRHYNGFENLTNRNVPLERSYETVFPGFSYVVRWSH